LLALDFSEKITPKARHKEPSPNVVPDDVPQIADIVDAIKSKIAAT
jgi:hypothetical protein